ncbi:MAG TPA: hypothetical protein VF743_06065, partial [Acidimicrobiales bacterium]
MGVVWASGASGGLLLASDLVERWRDTGPTLWVVAGAAAALWLVLLGAAAAVSQSRRVRAAAETLELGGPEPPAVVNLVTNDWQLGREAVPATLLDLAARGRLAVEQTGDRTTIRVREVRPGSRRPTDDRLTGYERMVLDHVRSLARGTADGTVPAEALTTGPDADSAGWWSRFTRAVVGDARDRGLSRPRWSPAVRALLVGAAVVVAFAVALAASTLRDDPDDPDDNPLSAAIGFGVVTFVVLSGAAAAVKGERDTPAGREAAARWLGLREALV